MRNADSIDNQRIRMDDTINFFLNYTRAYFDAFRIKEDRSEVWPIIFAIRNHYNEDNFTVDSVKVLVEADYDIVFTNHIVRSRVLDLSRCGYITIDPEPSCVQDVKSDSNIKITNKFTEGFITHAGECAWRLLPSYHKYLWNPEFENKLNKIIHDMIESQRKQWCAFVRGQLMSFCPVKNPVRAADFRKKILSNDVYWMMIASAWRNHLADHNQKEFTFDDMNHWLNRRSYVPVEVARDALLSLTSVKSAKEDNCASEDSLSLPVKEQSPQNKDKDNIFLPIFNKFPKPGLNLYSINEEIIPFLMEHTEELDKIRMSFYDLYLSILPKEGSAGSTRAA